MTINEMIKKLNDIPEKERDKDVSIYALGALIEDFKLSWRKCKEGPLVVIDTKKIKR